MGLDEFNKIMYEGYVKPQLESTLWQKIKKLITKRSKQ